MGIFSSKTKHYYNVSGTELYEDMPTLMSQTIRGAVEGNRNIAKDITANLVNGVLWNVRGLHKWASVAGNYPWGLPNGTMASIVTPKASVIQNIVAADLKKPVVHIGFVRVEPEGNTFVYYVEYWEVSPVGEITGSPDLWIYDTAENKYPALNIDSKYETITPYLPVMPIRVADKYIDQTSSAWDEEVYRKVKRALNYIDIDPDTLCDGMRESGSSDDLPDDCYVVLGASVSRGTERTNEYIYRFFKRMYGESRISYSDNQYWAANRVPTEEVREGRFTSVREVPHTSLPPTNRLNIKDSRYNQRLAWDYINHKIYKGSIGKVGTHKVTYRQVRDLPASYGLFGSRIYYRGAIYCRKQITATQVEEYYVSGLLTEFNVVGRENVGVALKDVYEDPEKLETPFLIPLRMDLLRDMGNIRSHDLIYESVWMMGMHHKKVKVKWYERGFFKIFTMIVVCVVSFIFAGPAGLALAVKGMIVAMVIGELFTPLLEDIFGAEIAMVISVIATAMVMGFDPTQLANQNASMVATTAAKVTPVVTIGISVESLAMAAMELYVGIKSFDLQDQMEDLEKAIDDLNAEMEEYQAAKKIDAYNKGITMANISSDPWNIMDPSQYVTNILSEPSKPLKGPLYTQHYVEASLHLDMPKTVINVGH